MEIAFVNTRFDPDLIEFHDVAKQMAKSVGHTAALKVEKQLAQLLRLRVAQINPCSYCLILHTKAAQDQGLPAAKIAHLASWRESNMFSNDERAALAYCEALTEYDLSVFPSTHLALQNYFDEKEIAEIAAIVINMNLWVRLKLAQGATPEVKGENSENTLG
ncbi:carboxymuconolactone decarboxylase family protein [Enterovibrio norvegicus]|uniref:carboxymuconolactone decarboxylase family protein n=1 Tax=Enterovibrio norvegicus TaxID=188144 RepID=UPI00352F8DCB